jgi:hypothetical protein
MRTAFSENLYREPFFTKTSIVVILNINAIALMFKIVSRSLQNLRFPILRENFLSQIITQLAIDDFVLEMVRQALSNRMNVVLYCFFCKKISLELANP